MNRLTKEELALEFSSSIEVKQRMLADQALIAQIFSAAQLLEQVLRADGTVYCCGNGGSSCDAMHLAQELVGRYKADRRGLKAMHLTDPSTITCWSNDYNFESAYSRQVETFCSSKDVLVAISTSGSSKNILKAVEAAKVKNCPVIALTSATGSKLAELSTIAIMVPHTGASNRTQEAHIMIIHGWCEYLDRAFI